MSAAVDPTPSMLLQRSTSLWRRLSRRGRSVSGSKATAKASSEPPNPTTPPPRKLQKRPMVAVAEPDENIQTEKNPLITHMQRIDVPYSHNINDASTPPAPSKRERVLASDMQTSPFPSSPLSMLHTVVWNVLLRPEQVYNLVMGFRPRATEDKWFVFSEGPDGTGKLKVHFHRSWTGIKIAELFILIDVKGEGAGKMVGIKWNGSEQTNGMDEEEAKYMIATTCAWVLGVHIESGGAPVSV